MQAQLERIHRIQLELALEVKRICGIHRLKYFLVAGTLLGAVRHKGFIPWDDDLDIGMLREDYDRFVAYAARELPDGYFLQTWDTDPGYGLSYAKLRVNGTKYVELNSANVKAHNGVFIDVFPYDNVPADPALQERHERAIRMSSLMLMAKKGYRFWAADHNVGTGIKFTLASRASFMFPTSHFKRVLDRECRRYDGPPADTVFLAGGSYGYRKEQLRRSWATELTELEFEGHRFSCPAAWDEYLTFLYGDYMTPPPEDKRYNMHSIIEIDLGSSQPADVRKAE